jgi:hypothetical protein
LRERRGDVLRRPRHARAYYAWDAAAGCRKVLPTKANTVLCFPAKMSCGGSAALSCRFRTLADGTVEYATFVAGYFDLSAEWQECPAGVSAMHDAAPVCP